MGDYIISAGSIVGLLLVVVGYFIQRLLHDLKQTTEECGKNKGRIELVEQQQVNDIKRMEERTQMQLEALTKNVNTLSKSVNDLVLLLANNGIKK